MEIRNAQQSDLEAVQNLLQASKLPTSDIVVGILLGFLVAIREDGRLTGVAGLEPLGSSVLLRSLVVEREERDKGIARQLVERLEAKAHSDGQKDIWLLTTTADRYFARIGYRTVDRTDVPEEVRLTQQFSSLCPATAVCMRKTLGPIT